MYKTREEQNHLLQQVLSASDTDADEERIIGEGPRQVIINCSHVCYWDFFLTISLFIDGKENWEHDIHVWS